MQMVYCPTDGSGIGNGQSILNGPLYTCMCVYTYIYIYMGNLWEIIELKVLFSSKPCLTTDW